MSADSPVVPGENTICRADISGEIDIRREITARVACRPRRRSVRCIHAAVAIRVAGKHAEHSPCQTLRLPAVVLPGASGAIIQE